MRKRILGFMLLVVAAVGLTACSDNDDVDTTATRNVVEVVVTPSGFGDLGYNDIILAGLEESRQRLGFDLVMHVPASVDEGIAIYRKWAEKKGCGERRLFVFASNQYEAALRSLGVLPTAAESDVLLFETGIPMAGVYTFRIGMYGAAYLIGAYTALTNYAGENRKAAAMAANPYDSNVDGAVVGFRDGFADAGGADVAIRYLSADQGAGYNLPTEAYSLCTSLHDEGYGFFFPVAGGSNKGVYQFSRNWLVGTAGIDGDMSAYSGLMNCSLIKEIGKATEDFIAQWIAKDDIPEHQDFLWQSGYVRVEYCHDWKETDAEGIDTFKNNIIGKEAEYENGK
ncbi:MAG: BMP family ABC transporter substrate-binding protein [Prevotella sp.]